MSVASDYKTVDKILAFCTDINKGDEKQDLLVQVCCREQVPLKSLQHERFVLIGRKPNTDQDVSCTSATSSLSCSTTDLEEDSQEDCTTETNDKDGKESFVMRASDNRDEEYVTTCPLSASEARWLVSRYLRGLKEEKMLPVLIHCSGEIDYMLCDSDGSVTTTSIRKTAPVCNTRADSLTSVTSLHCWGQEDVQLVREGFVHIDILENGCNDTVQGYQGDLSVEFTWQPVTSILQSPPIDAQATLLVAPVCGDCRSPFHNLHEELSKIESFITGISQGSMHWPESESITQRISKLFHEVELGDEARIVDDRISHENVDDKLQSSALRMEERLDLDFTESLWQILKDTPSYGELVQNLQHVFNVLQGGQIKPMVHTYNKTTLAQLLRDSYYNKMQAPSLEGTAPLRLVAEIGLEKVTRDFINVFLSQDWASQYQLQPFLSSSDPATQLDNLKKLELTLELAALLALYIKLPSQEIYQASRQALSYFAHQDAQLDHKFEIPVKTSLLSGILQSSTPKEWQLKLQSEGTTTLYQMSKLPQLETEDLCDPSDVHEETVNYQVTIVTSTSLPAVF